MGKEFKEKRFAVQAEYAESIFQTSLGNVEASIAALERALEIDSEYAPAILSMGSVEYQRGELNRGKELFLSLLSLPESAADDGERDLAEIIDEAGTFLIEKGRYSDGLELYRAAVNRFTDYTFLYQGVGCCADHEGLHTEAISALEASLKLEPENQELVNDLGWSLFEAGRLDDAKQMLAKAVEMNPSDVLARENLRICLNAFPEEDSKEYR
ncbi:MAG TPA: tetratricopeptide repeat protein [Bacteroidales bacterium]|jgi:tetratricopeptide (TPR) repeat protein|nr:tetratricopeptide repeat protein [Bacteroidales bacterium]HOX75949.1 tetratricopeptide repeat protein [Bacteroidales bacterium]HPM88905.1 tetratricopeptide repeat protein [Bacteroidales bacterium]HQM70663.1 tetratricopeptide repeat protein [Bacteroidales bacterium]